MMPYAAKGQISQDPLEEGIEITQEQYLEALAGMQDGCEVTIEGGLKIARPVPPDPVEQPE